MNLIRNNPVTNEDTQLSEKAHGPDFGGMNSESARSKPIAVRSQVFEIPDELFQVNEEIMLSTDGLNVNSLDL